MNNQKLQPVIDSHSGYTCPMCGKVLYGDGENGLACEGCDYKISESEVK